jgi:uncharacterized Fe-S cluster-containing protein
MGVAERSEQTGRSWLATTRRGYSRCVSTFPKSAIQQTVEIEDLVSEALEMLDQVRYSLKTLEDRLKAAQA